LDEKRKENKTPRTVRDGDNCAGADGRRLPSNNNVFVNVGNYGGPRYDAQGDATLPHYVQDGDERAERPAHGHD